MRAGDRDRALERGRLREQVAAVDDAEPSVTRTHELGVVVGYRCRHHDLRSVGHVRGIVADHGIDANLAQQRRVRRLGAIRAAHRGAESTRDERESAHSRATDPDEVQPPPTPVRARHASAPLP